MAFKLITMGVLCQMERRFVSLSIDSRFFFQDCLGEFDLAFYHGVCCRRRKWGVFHECSSTYNQRPTEILCSLALMGMGNEHRREDWLQWPSNFLSRSPLEFHGFSNATLYLFCFLLLARYHQFALALASIVCGSKKWRKKNARPHTQRLRR